MHVTLVGDEAATAALRPVLQGVLEAGGVRPRFSRAPVLLPRDVLARAPDPDDGLAAVYVWFGEGAHGARVIVVARDDRVVSRRFDHGSPAAIREEVAQVLAGVAEALSLGQMVGVPRRDVAAAEPPSKPEPEPESKPEPAPPPEPPVVVRGVLQSPVEPAPMRVRMLGGWFAESYAPEIPVRHGPRLGLSLWRGSLGGFARASYLLSQDADAAPVGVRVQSLRARLGGAWRLRFASRTELVAGAGVAIEATRHEAVSAIEGPLRGPRWQASPIAGLLLGAYQGLSGWADVGIEVAADIDPVPTPYEYGVGGVERTAAAPRPWRIGIAIAVLAGANSAP